MFKKPRTIYKSVLDELEKKVAKSPNMSIITGEELRGYVGGWCGGNGTQGSPFQEWYFNMRQWEGTWTGGVVSMPWGDVYMPGCTSCSSSNSNSGSENPCSSNTSTPVARTYAGNQSNPRPENDKERNDWRGGWVGTNRENARFYSVNGHRYEPSCGLHVLADIFRTNTHNIFNIACGLGIRPDGEGFLSMSNIKRIANFLGRTMCLVNVSSVAREGGTFIMEIGINSRTKNHGVNVTSIIPQGDGTYRIEYNDRAFGLEDESITVSGSVQIWRLN